MRRIWWFARARDYKFRRTCESDPLTCVHFNHVFTFTQCATTPTKCLLLFHPFDFYNEMCSANGSRFSRSNVGFEKIILAILDSSSKFWYSFQNTVTAFSILGNGFGWAKFDYAKRSKFNALKMWAHTHSCTLFLNLLNIGSDVCERGEGKFEKVQFFLGGGAISIFLYIPIWETCLCMGFSEIGKYCVIKEQ